MALTEEMKQSGLYREITAEMIYNSRQYKDRKTKGARALAWEKSGLPANKVLSCLTILEIKGIIVRDLSGNIELNKNFDE